jgi:hypothetical protein
VKIAVICMASLFVRFPIESRILRLYQMRSYQLVSFAKLIIQSAAPDRLTSYVGAGFSPRIKDTNLNR